MCSQASWGKPAVPALQLETKVGSAGAGSQSLAATQHVRGQLFSKEKRKRKRKKEWWGLEETEKRKKKKQQLVEKKP